MQYCSLQHRTYLHHQSHPQLGVFLFVCLFVLLWFCLFILPVVFSLLISGRILGTYWPGKFIFQCLIFLFFPTVHGIFKARTLKWFAIPFSSRPCFVRTLHHDPYVLCGMAHSCIELYKAVVHVIRLVNFLSLWFLVCLPSDEEG